MKVPLDVQATGMKLWGYVDDEGRAELRPDLIAAHVAPGRDVMQTVEEHLVVLDDAGFLRMYEAAGLWWIELCRPLRTPRPLASECPAPQEPSGGFLAVGGARERAEARVRAEQAERSREWSEWEQAQDVPRMPRRPLLIDAPPLGCPEHPDGTFPDCGPCGTARRRHDRWVQQERYTQQVTDWERSRGGDDEPF